jgi:Proto-chlorophyllide reductase 57 kD subunit
MAGARPDAFEGGGGAGETAGPGCPFAAALGEAAAAAPAPGEVRWSPEAEARLERIPSFIRPMARRSIERFAQDKGHATITEAVMDEARTVFGM